MIQLGIRSRSLTKKSDSDTDPQCCYESDSDSTQKSPTPYDSASLRLRVWKWSQTEIIFISFETSRLSVNILPHVCFRLDYWFREGVRSQFLLGFQKNKQNMNSASHCALISIVFESWNTLENWFYWFCLSFRFIWVLSTIVSTANVLKYS